LGEPRRFLTFAYGARDSSLGEREFYRSAARRRLFTTFG
jgi:hypothetical protein